VVFAGLSCWLLIAARGGGGDFGMVERLTAAVQGLFPLVVAHGVRRAAWDAGNQGQPGQEHSDTGTRANSYTALVEPGRVTRSPDR
jgi:hypothetical protein